MHKARLCDEGANWSKFRIESDGGDKTYREVLDLWQSETSFQGRFTDWLANSPHEAVFFEARPVRAQDLDQAFEFVLADANSLRGIAATPAVFAAHYGQDDVVCFPNLGADAELVVPCPTHAGTDYAHLAAFCRTASADQANLFWQLAGQRMAQLIGVSPLWLSTSGLGVAWLHLRIDQFPKYYTHAPYRHL